MGRAFDEQRYECVVRARAAVTPPSDGGAAAKAKKQRNQGLGCLVVIVIGIWLAVSGSHGSSPAAPNAPPVNVPPAPSTEQMLAAIDGDGSSVAAFGRILDTLQAGSSICAPEPNRTHAADVIVASWNQSNKKVRLLEWARSLASVCEP